MGGSNSSEERTSLGEIGVRLASGSLQAIKCCLVRAGSNWKIIFDSSKACKLNLMKGGQWILRLDGPHRGANFEHINLNPEFWGLPADPHTALPSGCLKAGVTFGRFSQLIHQFSRGLFILAIMIDAGRILKAMYKDFGEGTYRHTVDTIASVAGGWTGGYLGCLAGAAVGTAFLPGVGTIIGGIVGSIVGAFAGSYVGPKVVGGAVDGIESLIKELKAQGFDEDGKDL